LPTLTDYLESDRTSTHSFDKDDEQVTIPISRMGGAAITVDEKAYELLEEEFGLYDEDASLPGTEIEEYFEGRPESVFNHWVERERITTDENENPLFSELIERKAGNCAEEAITAHIWADERLDRYTSHFVNGKVIYDNNQIGHHAFVVLEDNEENENALIDPDNTVSTNNGDLILNSGIESVDEYEIVLEENWQNYVDGCGFRYSF